MKKVTRKEMKEIAQRMFPELPHDEAMALLKSKDLFVRMRNKKYYVVRDAIYEKYLI